MNAQESTVEAMVKRVRQAAPREREPADAGRPTDAAGVSRPMEPSPAPLERVARLEKQCARLANELSSVARDADRRDREQREQILGLVRRLHECEAELAEKDARLAAALEAHAALESQVDGGAVGITAAAAVYRKELQRNADLLERLRAGLEDRGRALAIAREQIVALHQDRARLTDALRERSRQVAQLLAQLTRGEVRAGFAVDFHSGLERLLERDPAVATVGHPGAAGEPADVNEETIVLESDGSGGGRRPARSQDASPAPRRAPRLRRFLMPMEPEEDQPFELAGPRCYVGRGVEADVCLSHRSVSRLHGVLYSIGGSTLVEDARSTNGVFVNRERVQQAVLKDGDIVSFGEVGFRFRVAAG
jgi:hypothetical protein